MGCFFLDLVIPIEMKPLPRLVTLAEDTPEETPPAK